METTGWKKSGESQGQASVFYLTRRAPRDSIALASVIC